MDTIPPLQYKQKLFEMAVRILEQRVQVCQLAIDNAQVAANEEDKSSAGDKYETSRAMSHIEKDMYAKQLAANKNDLAGLMGVDCNRLYDSVIPGSIIKCTGFSFFIAAGLGKLSFENEIVYFLSPNAPIAHLIYNKKTGDQFIFNGKEVLIQAVY